MDEKQANQVRIEGLYEDLDQALTNGDWEEARTCLKELEGMKVDTYELRRKMNDSMAEERNDFDAQEHLDTEARERESTHDSYLSNQAN